MTEVSYPVSVYVFDASDKCVAVTTINSDAETISFKLPKGTYDIYALAGADSNNYDLPSQEKVTPKTVISLKDNRQHGDLMTTHNSVVLGEEEENTLTLSLERKVMKLESVRILNVPDDVTSVSVTINPLYKELLLDGSYSGTDGFYTANLVKDSDGTTWKSTSPVFLLGQSSQTTVKVLMTSADGNISYSYSCAEALDANYKVNITGTYTGNDVRLSGTISGVAWKGTKDITFSFDGTSETDTTEEPVLPADVPEAGTLYKGSYVLKTEQSGRNVVVTLMSLNYKDKLDFTVGDEESLETAVDEAIAELAVPEISGWRLPSKAELDYIIDNYAEVSDGLTSNGGVNFFTGSYSYYFKTDDGKIYSYDLSGEDSGINETPGRGALCVLRAFATVIF